MLIMVLSHMARKHRASAAGIAEHVIQRGNNRQVIFANKDDMAAYAAWLKEYAIKYRVNIHAWVFMTNHVHLLCTPADSTGISKMMQSMGRMYVLYFNKRHNRTGTLWEGRYKSCLVESDKYLLTLYRYIELNPVRAGMVSDPAEYTWSSYQCNGLGKQTDMQTHHQLYLSLGTSSQTRQLAYRALFKSKVQGKMLDDIRHSANKGLALGSDSFIANVEAVTGQRLIQQKRGRPVGWRKLSK